MKYELDAWISIHIEKLSVTSEISYQGYLVFTEDFFDECIAQVIPNNYHQHGIVSLASKSLYCKDNDSPPVSIINWDYVLGCYSQRKKTFFSEEDI